MILSNIEYTILQYSGNVVSGRGNGGGSCSGSGGGGGGDSLN